MEKNPLKLEKFRIASLKELSKIQGGTVTTGNDSQECDTNTNPYTTNDPATNGTGDTINCSQTTQTAGTRTDPDPPTSIPNTNNTNTNTQQPDL